MTYIKLFYEKQNLLMKNYYTVRHKILEYEES